MTTTHDLSAAAQVLVPVATPLLNQLPRVPVSSHVDRQVWKSVIGFHEETASPKKVNCQMLMLEDVYETIISTPRLPDDAGEGDRTARAIVQSLYTLKIAEEAHIIRCLIAQMRAHATEGFLLGASVVDASGAHPAETMTSWIDPLMRETTVLLIYPEQDTQQWGKIVPAAMSVAHPACPAGHLLALPRQFPYPTADANDPLEILVAESYTGVVADDGTISARTRILVKNNFIGASGLLTYSFPQ